MRNRLCFSSPVLLLLSFHLVRTLAQHSTGYTCAANQTASPCQTYVFYRANAPNFLDLASIGDLFGVSRPMIAKPSNISNPSAPLLPNQPLFIPITCSCNAVNASFIISFANITYTIKSGDTLYHVSTDYFQNLTTYESVESVDPTLVPTNLSIGDAVNFPIFCKCPNSTQLRNRVNYLISYVFQPTDTFSSIASRFGVGTQSLISLNGNKVKIFDPIFIPVTQLPQLSQPAVSPSSPAAITTERKGLITGLAIGIGIFGVLLILALIVLVLWKRREMERDEEKQKVQFNKGGRGMGTKGVEMNFMADVSECLDKYKVFQIEELREATDDFSDSCLIQGSVYRGSINGEVYAIKKMKWDAYEELKILQKVNY